MKKNRLSLAFLGLLIAASPLRAQDTLQNETVEQKDKRMEWFSQAKLGYLYPLGNLFRQRSVRKLVLL